jgi:hypothetical protein
LRGVGIAAALACAVAACSGSLANNGDGGGGAGGIGSIAGGGSGGQAATSGGTGESCLPMTPPPDACGAALCGNQTRDTCRVPGGLGFCPLVDVSEECDGADLGARSCLTLGYGSGVLVCSDNCRFDARGCSECLPPTLSLFRCGAAPFAAEPLVQAIAASDAEVALAWIERMGVEPPRLRFARLSPGLDLVAASTIDDPALAAFPMGGGSSYFAVSVATLPSGWAIAGYAGPDFFLHALDASGQSGARIRLDTAAIADVLAYPVLAGRADGGPLVLWQTSTALRVAVVAPDGRSTTTPLALPVSGRLANYPRVAFAGGAFHVLAPIDSGTSTALLRVFRIATDGTLASTFDVLPGLTFEHVQLVPGADDLRIVYSDGERAFWRKLGPTGAPLSAPVAIGSGYDFGGDARAIGFGADTVALLIGVNSANTLSITHIGPDGQIVRSPEKIAIGLGGGIGWHDIVRRGPDAVAAWLANGPGIRVARFLP